MHNQELFGIFRCYRAWLYIAGTTLLVESLDRLSREKVGEAIERLKLILNHGIDVITLCDNTVYNIDSLNDPYSLIKAILIAQRANEESEIKSSRVKLSWKKNGRMHWSQARL